MRPYRARSVRSVSQINKVFFAENISQKPILRGNKVLFHKISDN